MPLREHLNACACYELVMTLDKGRKAEERRRILKNKKGQR
jgi:hypothetical protein